MTAMGENWKKIKFDKQKTPYSGNEGVGLLVKYNEGSLDLTRNPFMLKINNYKAKSVH